jgi:ribosomal protein S9
MASRRLERGQATTDYIALLAVVVALVAVGATLTGVGAPGVVNAVRAQIAHALCIVTGRACHAERSLPCTVAMRRESRRYGLNLAFISCRTARCA